MKYNFLKIWIFIIIWIGLGMQIGYGQQDPLAESILKQVSKKYKSYKRISAAFTHIITDNHGKKLSTTKGTLLAQNKKFNLKTGKDRLICNGQTIWNILYDQKEVNISDYMPEEGEITPTSIYTLYEKGYKYIMIGEIKGKNGRILQAIDLEPTSQQSQITKIRLFVDKKTSMLSLWVAYERGSNNRHTWQIDKFVPNGTISPENFDFNKNTYKNYKIIDIR